MIALSYQKVFKALALIAGIIIIAIPDVIGGLLIELLHVLLELFLELAHIAFEWVESSLDTVVEHLFETDRRQTQIIVFYIIFSAVCYGLYRLSRVLPRFYLYLKKHLLAAWELHKTRVLIYWRGTALIDRIKLIAIIASIAYLASFLFM